MGITGTMSMALSGALYADLGDRACGDGAGTGFGRHLRAVSARLGDSIEEMIRHSAPIQHMFFHRKLAGTISSRVPVLQRTQFVIGFRPKEDWPMRELQ